MGDVDILERQRVGETRQHYQDGCPPGRRSARTPAPAAEPRAGRINDVAPPLVAAFLQASRRLGHRGPNVSLARRESLIPAALCGWADGPETGARRPGCDFTARTRPVASGSHAPHREAAEPAESTPRPASNDLVIFRGQGYAAEQALSSSISSSAECSSHLGRATARNAGSYVDVPGSRQEILGWASRCRAVRCSSPSTRSATTSSHSR